LQEEAGNYQLPPWVDKQTKLHK